MLAVGRLSSKRLISKGEQLKIGLLITCTYKGISNKSNF